MALYNDNYIETSQNQSNSLDNMARCINNAKKTKLNDVYNKFRSDKAMLTRGLNNLVESDVLQLSNADIGNPDGFYSTQGEYLSFGDAKKTKQEINKEISTNNDQSIDVSSIDVSSIDTPRDNSTISDNDIKTEIITKSKFNKSTKMRHNCVDFDLDSVDSLESLESGESLLDHINGCATCKKKLIMLIKKNKCHSNLAKLLPVTAHKQQFELMSPVNQTFRFNIKEIKEIIVIIMVGLLIIIVIDMLAK